MKEVTDPEEASKIAKAQASKYRVRFLQILREQPTHSMLESDLIAECSRDPEYYLVYGTADHHLEPMVDAGIVALEDVVLPQKTKKGRKKVQAKITLLKDVRIFCSDLPKQ